MMDFNFARELIRRFGSPIYAYDLDKVERRAEELFHILPPGSAIYYSFKANPLPGIASVLRKNGCRAEITSSGELKSATMAGFQPQELLYGGPAKTTEEIEEALQHGIRRFSCESFTDLARLQCGAKKFGVSIEILLRVNPSKAPHAKLAMTGIESQFGFEEEALLSGVEQIRTLDKEVKVIGVHIYYGTQIAPEALTATTANALESAERISKQLGFACQIVNAGGGFPWPYASADAGPSLEGVKEGYAALAQSSDFARSVQFWFESGRYLSASSGTLIATVMDVKVSKGKKFVILDTGIHHLGGMSGLGRIPRPFLALQPLKDFDPADVESVDVVGPLCSPLDSLARGIKVPRLNPGDVIAVPNVGAYGLSASLVGFLSHPTPAEVTYRGTECAEVFRLGWGHQKA